MWSLSAILAVIHGQNYGFSSGVEFDPTDLEYFSSNSV